MNTPEHKKISGIRAENEDDRSAEFKAERSRLAANVNEWLAGLAAKRDAGEAMENGERVTDKPRIIRTMIGKTAAGTGTVAEEIHPGISLAGDGVMTRFVLQAYVPTEGDAGTSTIEVKGSDPMERMVTGEEYTMENSNITDVSGDLIEEVPGQQLRKYGFEIRGDGAVQRKFVNRHGYNCAMPVRTIEDVLMAAMTFEHIKGAIE